MIQEMDAILTLANLARLCGLAAMLSMGAMAYALAILHRNRRRVVNVQASAIAPLLLSIALTMALYAQRSSVIDHFVREGLTPPIVSRGFAVGMVVSTLLALWGSSALVYCLKNQCERKAP